MVLNRAVLELDADVDGDGTVETGVFHMVGDLEVQMNVRTSFLVGGAGSTINAVVAGLLGDGNRNRKGYALDLGAGRYQIEINFTGWEGSVDGDGNSLQWGNTGNGGTVGDATGEDPFTQIQCLNEYLRVGVFDSVQSSARLRFGEYNDNTYGGGGGRYDDFLTVAVESATQPRTSQDPNAYNGSISMFEVGSWQDVIDAAEKLVI